MDLNSVTVDFTCLAVRDLPRSLPSPRLGSRRRPLRIGSVYSNVVELFVDYHPAVANSILQFPDRELSVASEIGVSSLKFRLGLKAEHIRLEMRTSQLCLVIGACLDDLAVKKI